MNRREAMAAAAGTLTGAVAGENLVSPLEARSLTFHQVQGQTVVVIEVAPETNIWFESEFEIDGKSVNALELIAAHVKKSLSGIPDLQVLVLPANIHLGSIRTIGGSGS